MQTLVPDRGGTPEPPDPHGPPMSWPDLMIAILGGATVVGAAATLGVVAAAAGAAAAVYLLACLRRPHLIGYTLVAVVPVASGVARGLPIPGVRLTEAMAVGAAAVVLGRNVAGRRVRWLALDWLALAYVAAHVVVSGLAAFLNDALAGADLGQMVGPVQFFLLYRVIVTTLDTPHRRTVGVRILLVMVVPVALLSLAQYLGAPGVQAAVQQLTDTDVFDLYSYDATRRATGPFAAWHPLAGYLFLPMILAAAVALQRSSAVMSRRAAWTVLAFGAMSLLVSQTLNVLAGALVCFVIVAAMQGTDRKVLGGLVVSVVVVGAVFAPVLGQRLESQQVEDPLAQGVQLPETIQYRIEVWQDQFFPAIGRHWMIGYGPDLPPEITWRHTESLYFTLLLRGGVVLLGAFAAFMVVTVQRCMRLRGSPDLTVRAVAVTLVASTVALIPMHAVFPYFTASGLPQVFWILLGLVTSKLVEDRDRQLVRDHTDGTAGRSASV